jgi:hypothetical protein
MAEKINVLKKFLKILEKNKFEVENNSEVKNELNKILEMDFNPKHHDISQDHFKEKFPQFNENVHKLLSRCAKETRYDYRKKNRFNIIKKNIIVEFT